MRFLISLSSFAILQEKARPSTPVNGTTSIGSKLLSQPLARLRYRDNLWAFFSHSQEILISESSNVCNGPMLWADARALGLPLWIKSTDALVCPRIDASNPGLTVALVRTARNHCKERVHIG